MHGYAGQNLLLDADQMSVNQKHGLKIYCPHSGTTQMQKEMLQNYPISKIEESWALVNTKKLFAQLQEKPHCLQTADLPSDDIGPNFSYSSINACLECNSSCCYLLI